MTLKSSTYNTKLYKMDLDYKTLLILYTALFFTKQIDHFYIFRIKISDAITIYT